MKVNFFRNSNGLLPYFKLPEIMLHLLSFVK
jgi:hypothetical protein